MTLTIEQLKARFKKNDNRNENGGGRQNNYYPFWDMQVGEQAVVRFLPDKNPENPLGFMVEKLMHTLTINGENKSVPCKRMYNEDCPICKVSNAFYKEDDKANGKKYWRKKQYIAQALIVEDPLAPDEKTGENHEGKVRFLALGYQLFEVIKNAFESGDLEEVPYSPEGGYNFVIKKTQQGDYATYAIGSRFKPKQVSLTEDQLELVSEHSVDLSTLLPANPDTAKVEAMLEAALTGGTYSESEDGEEKPNFKQVAKPAATKPAAKPTKVVDEDEEEDDEDAKPATKPAAKPVAAAKPAAAAQADEEDSDEEADRILAQIRARRTGKAS